MLWPNGEDRPSPFRFPGIATALDRGLRLGVVSKLLAPWGLIPPTPKGRVQADWVSGASMILRRTTLEQIGLLDEGLYTYCDDVDICWRARQAGWEVWYVPESQVIHLGGAATGITDQKADRLPPYWFQARRRLFLKNYGKVRTALADAAFLTGFVLWRVRRQIQRKPDTDPASMLTDSMRHSVFCTGFALRDVENPALAEAVAQAEGTTRSPSIAGTTLE
jgi:GT2 family glycosyltransferase